MTSRRGRRLSTSSSRTSAGAADEPTVCTRWMTSCAARKSPAAPHHLRERGVAPLRRFEVEVSLSTDDHDVGALGLEDNPRGGLALLLEHFRVHAGPGGARPELGDEDGHPVVRVCHTPLVSRLLVGAGRPSKAAKASRPGVNAESTAMPTSLLYRDARL